MNKKPTPTLLCGLLLTSIAHADIKNLVCDDPIAESGLKESLDWTQRMCNKGVQDSCENVPRIIAQIQECKSSTFSERMIFTFDTSSLEGRSNMYAEQVLVPCSNSNSRFVKKVGIESTPSFIIMKMPNEANFPHDIFTNAGLDKFVINRKTLVGTYANKSTWNCRVEDVPKGKNQI